MALDGLLDTNILIDISRRYPLALNWLHHTPLRLAVSSFTRMELIVGARNRSEQEKIIQLLKPYGLVFPQAADAKWAMEQFEIFHLSHQIELIDCLIAATAVGLDIPIYTRNVKDMSLLPAVKLVVPY